MVEMTQTDGDILAMLRDTAREWVAGEHPAHPEHDVHRGDARVRWRTMAELGWTGLSVPEQHGGLELGLKAHGVLAEALGRELAATPLMSTGLLAVEALKGQGVADALLSGVVTGDLVFAAAFDEGPRHGAPLTATAQPSAGGWRLKAHKRYVVDGADADWFLVSARWEQPELFLVARTQCRIEVLDTIDGRSMAHVSVEADLPDDARLEGGETLVQRLGDLARLFLAAEMLGAGHRIFEITLDYLKTREQFGQPIGAFQALQHRAAQILVDLELARAALNHGLAVADDGREDLASASTLAKYMAGEALHRATNEAVQMHGGIGMTAEHVAGRYLKWARVSEALFGSGAWLAGHYADANGY